jgi:4-methyl-5(b-hydroxyethyl)-thiazole monophosphate biosynthesis
MSSISVLIPLAPGFEDIEGVTIIDVLRRADINVTVAGVKPGLIEASRKTRIQPDTSLEEASQKTFDAVVLPGGLPGTDHLRESKQLKEITLRHARDGKIIGAICAAPTVLNEWGLLDGKKATSFPGMRSHMTKCSYQEDAVVVDGKVITSRGPGTAMQFSLKLVEVLKGRELAVQVGKDLLAGQ